DKLNDIINDPRTTDAMRRMASVELRNIQRMTNGPALAPPMPPVTAPQGRAVAQTTDAPVSAPVPENPGAPPAIAPVPDPRSPDQMYRDVIKNALIEAMLSFGPVLRLADDEWLTVAARATSPNVSNQLDDSSSILIRIKGADLADFLNKKITRDE